MRDLCLFGDCRESMRKLIADGVKVQTCVTSPPYWGLRDYGVEGQLGLEPTPDAYVTNMVEVFRLVRELLADDGTLWLNLGDSYANAGNPHQKDFSASVVGYGGTGRSAVGGQPAKMIPPGLKPKDLVGIPWRVAFALQADGWYLRSDIIWHKPNPMPESVTDRPTKAHEYLFLLSKRERYFYDADAIKEPSVDPIGSGNRYKSEFGGAKVDARIAQGLITTPKGMREFNAERNRRTVWTVATEPYSEAHFATFPTALIEPCILAGTSQKGHCPACGKGWARVVEHSGVSRERNTSIKTDKALAGVNAVHQLNGKDYVHARRPTDEWQPACACNLEPVPGIVFDPFLGSGTTAQVAQDLGRHWLGCELNAQYCNLQTRRTEQLGMALA